MSEQLTEKELRIRLKCAQIKSLRKEADKFKALYRHTGKPIFASKLMNTKGKIAGLSFDLDHLRELSIPA